jgi:hypothetical protein
MNSPAQASTVNADDFTVSGLALTFDLIMIFFCIHCNSLQQGVDANSRMSAVKTISFATGWHTVNDPGWGNVGVTIA